MAAPRPPVSAAPVCNHRWRAQVDAAMRPVLGVELLGSEAR